MNQTDIGFLSVGTDLAHTQVWDRSSVSAKVQYTNITPYYGLIDQRVDWISPLTSLQGTTAFRQQIGKDGLLKFLEILINQISPCTIMTLTIRISHNAWMLLITMVHGNVAYQQSLNKKWSVRGGLAYSYNENAAKFDDIRRVKQKKVFILK